LARHDEAVMAVVHAILDLAPGEQCPFCPLRATGVCDSCDELARAVEAGRELGLMAAATEADRWESAAAAATAIRDLAAADQRVTITEAGRAALRCFHLADSDEPAPNLGPEPCARCGRYYVDDQERG
jgi:hypothetical protein